MLSYKAKGFASTEKMKHIFWHVNTYNHNGHELQQDLQFGTWTSLSTTCWLLRCPSQKSCYYSYQNDTAYYIKEKKIIYQRIINSKPHFYFNPCQLQTWTNKKHNFKIKNSRNSKNIYEQGKMMD